MFGFHPGSNAAKTIFLLHSLIIQWRIAASTYQIAEMPHHFYTRILVMPKTLEKQYNSEKQMTSKDEEASMLEKIIKDHLWEASNNKFRRSIKAEDNSKIMTIDISPLSRGHFGLEGGSGHREPLKLMGIDISALSGNPEPSLPISQSQFSDIPEPNDLNSVFNEPHDSSYDKFPFSQDNSFNNNHSSRPNTEANDIVIFPLYYLPHKAMTAYSVVKKTKMQGKDRKHFSSTNFPLYPRTHIYSIFQQQQIAKFASRLLAQLNFLHLLEMPETVKRSVFPLGQYNTNSEDTGSFVLHLAPKFGNKASMNILKYLSNSSMKNSFQTTGEGHRSKENIKRSTYMNKFGTFQKSNKLQLQKNAIKNKLHQLVYQQESTDTE